MTTVPDRRRCVFILSITSDIGRQLAHYYLEDGCSVVGTYRTKKALNGLENGPALLLFPCDLSDKGSIQDLVNSFRMSDWKWDTFISCASTEEPIGSFFKCAFHEWEQSIRTNFVGQLEVLHRLYPLRRQPMSHVVLFAGPGTNNAAPCYSALTVSKIAQIKMAELLDTENEDLNIFIVGPGWVRTKAHLETLAAGERAGSNYVRVKNFLESGDQGTTFVDIFEHIEWHIACGKSVSSGRNFSTASDAWKSESLREELLRNSDMYKLRRYRNEWKP